MTFSKIKDFFKRNIIEIWLALTLFVIFTAMSVKMEVSDNFCPHDYVWCMPERAVSSYDASAERVVPGRCNIYGCGGIQLINIPYLIIDMLCAYLVAHSIVFMAKKYIAEREGGGDFRAYKAFGFVGRAQRCQ